MNRAEKSGTRAGRSSWPCVRFRPAAFSTFDRVPLAHAHGQQEDKGWGQANKGISADVCVWRKDKERLRDRAGAEGERKEKVARALGNQVGHQGGGRKCELRRIRGLLWSKSGSEGVNSNSNRRTINGK